MHTSISPADAANRPFDLQRCIDALERGDCTEDEFLSEALELRGTDAASAWDVLAFIDQRYRRGQLAGPIFHSLKSRIAHHALDHRRDGETIELPGRPPEAAPAAGPAAHVLGAHTPAPQDTSIQVGRLVRDRYRVRALLGRGGMGDIFMAADELSALHAESPAQVAIKVLRARIDQRPELLVKLQREFDCTRRLSHPNIVKVYEFHRDGEGAFYTMELLEGEHAGELLQRELGHPLPRPYAWGVIRAVGAALAHAHSRGVIHGDVSPKNIMITRSGEVRVLDFGSSTLSQGAGARPAQVRTDAVAATPAYASCELLAGEPAEARDDLFSLACVAYELLTGEHPFRRVRASEARTAGLEAKRPGQLADSQWRILLQGLSWSREDRSISVREWLRELGLEPEPDRLPALTAPPPAAPAHGAAPWRWVAAGAALAAAGLILAAVSARRHAAGDAPVTAPSEQASDPPEARAAGAPEVDTRPDGSFATPSPAPAAASQATMAPAAGKPPLIRFTFHRHIVRRNTHFLELPVWRSQASADAGRFVWWTADASAKGGVDFVPQAPTAYKFPPGQRVASVFVKLLSHPGRHANTDFRVCLGRGGGAAGLADVRCSEVVLPAHSG